MNILIKILLSPMTLSVNIMLLLLTAIVFVADIFVKGLWIFLKPIRVTINFIVKLIKNKINHYKNKDAWKEYYDN